MSVYISLNYKCYKWCCAQSVRAKVLINFNFVTDLCVPYGSK